MTIPNPFPWYDSIWLSKYVFARDLVRGQHPERAAEFEAAFDPLRTRSDFEVIHLPSVFDVDTMDDLRAAVAALRMSQLEVHEVERFGRHIVHGHPLVTDLQADLVELVSDLAGEPVEPCYNFLSLYRDHGVCEVHMDAPEAKWTLDLCIQQSEPWPIYFSQIVDWPEDLRCTGPDWEEEVRSQPGLEFHSYELEPGEAILFSGSSQWHYREPQPGSDGERFCDLVFFHFVPAGTEHLVRSRHWAREFGLAELSVLET